MTSLPWPLVAIGTLAVLVWAGALAVASRASDCSDAIRWLGDTVETTCEPGRRAEVSGNFLVCRCGR